MPKKYGNMSDAQYQDRVRLIEKRRERQLEEDYKAAAGEPFGRRLLYYLIFELCNLESASFTPHVKDGIAAALHTTRNEGMREVGAEILSKLQDLAPALYLLMLEEQIRQRQAELLEEGLPDEEPDQ